MQVTPGRAKEIRREYRIGNALFLEQEAGLIRLVVQNEAVIRVSYTENGCFSREQGMEFARPDSDCSWEYEKDEREIRILTGLLAVRVSRADGSIRYEERDGRLLLSEALQESKTVEEFDSWRTVESADSGIEEVKTPDGLKRRICNPRREFDKKLYHTRISFRFLPDEILFGLGQGEEGVWNLRHTTQYLHQANLKIAIPMLLSDNGYGILLSTQSAALFEDTQYGSYLYTEADEYLDYYFMAGNPADIVRAYRRLTGRAAMLPKWAFGYLQSKERYESAQEIIETARKFRETGFGLDAIVLDWMSWEGDLWGQKTFDRERFPDPAGMIQALHEMDVRFMISIWPNMNEKCDNYMELKEAGLLLPNSNIYNAFDGEGRKRYWQQAERGLFSHGVDAWWCDSSEPVTPEWERAQKPPAGEMYRNFVEEAAKLMPLEKINAYGYYHARAIYEGQKGVTDKKRVVNLTRNGYVGSQKYGTILWSGDIYASWETLKRQIVAGLQFCACGLPYWTLDIGAFFVKKGRQWFWNGRFPEGTEDMGYRELYVRWFQYGAFLPVFRSHGTDCAREPWHFGEKGDPFYEALRNANHLRYVLMPYIYSLAGAVWKSDAVMMRPLIFDFPEDKRAAEISLQYMFGPALLVCPVTKPLFYRENSTPVRDPKKEMTVYLPAGSDWYDFYTGQRYAGGQKIKAKLCLERIPVYVRAGSLLPVSIPRRSNACAEKESPEEIFWLSVDAGGQALSASCKGRDIELRVYPGADGAFELYEDAGDGYGYENGDYCVTAFSYDDRTGRVEWKTAGNPGYREGEIRVKLCGSAEADDASGADSGI